jgi:hypothetical protein
MQYLCQPPLLLSHLHLHAPLRLSEKYNAYIHADTFWLISMAACSPRLDSAHPLNAINDSFQSPGPLLKELKYDCSITGQNLRNLKPISAKPTVSSSGPACKTL